MTLKLGTFYNNRLVNEISRRARFEDLKPQCPHCLVAMYIMTPNISLRFAAIDKIETDFTCEDCGYKERAIFKIKYDHSVVLFDPTTVPTAKMNPVESSVIAELGYDKSTKTMFIKFCSGDKIYAYENVDMEFYIDFLNADHKGYFYNDNIRGKIFSVTSKSKRF